MIVGKQTKSFSNMGIDRICFNSLEVIFQFPWVGDNLVYKDPNKKSLGYTFREGRTRKKKAELLEKLAS
jgi:hypothetical protein